MTTNFEIKCQMLFISYIKIDVKILSNRLYQVHLTMVVNQTRNRCGDTMKIKLTNRNKNAVKMFTLQQNEMGDLLASLGYVNVAVTKTTAYYLLKEIFGKCVSDLCLTLNEQFSVI